MKKKTKDIFTIQLLSILFSVSTVCVKMSSLSWEKNGLISVTTFIWFIIAVLILGIYAVFWQMLLKRFELSIAYLNKSTVIVWNIIWALILFQEELTMANILGIVCILLGVYLVSANE